MLHNSLLRKFSSIRLSEQEATVFTSLLAASEALGKGTVLRAAGGWVRDKLMGRDSCDIDIALDNVPGDEFALFLYEREKDLGSCSSIGIVKENPLQSKHIRTASFRFHGLELDVNNLRSETYTEDSRIPTVQFATHPSEDALRRDFTINALYYNLNTKEIEDFTGTGLSDLAQGLVRTPLPALQTFVDDPLRVLRAIRFASRFSFQLDADIVEAWKSEAVLACLTNKVSRERIGTEITKMLSHNPTSAITLIESSGLLSQILLPPQTCVPGLTKKDFDAWVANRQVSESLIPRFSQLTLDRFSFPSELLHVLYLSVLFSGGSPNPLLIVRLSMKLPNRECKQISAVLGSVSSMQQNLIQFDPKSVGRLIRRDLKELYPVSVLVGLLSRQEIAVDNVLPEFEAFMKQIAEAGLSACHEWRPIIDGSELQELLQVKPGKVIQELVDLQFDLMYERHDRTRDEILVASRKYLN